MKAWQAYLLRGSYYPTSGINGLTYRMPLRPPIFASPNAEQSLVTEGSLPQIVPHKHPYRKPA